MNPLSASRRTGTALFVALPLIVGPVVSGICEVPTTKPAAACPSARECMLRGDFERAGQLYDDMAKKEPIRAACGRAEIDRLTGVYQAGIERLMAVEERGRNSTEWLVSLAGLLTEVGRYDEAVQRLKSALALNDEHMVARCALGRLNELLGRNGEARDVYQRFEDAMTGATLPDRPEDLVALGHGFYRYSTLTRHPDIVQRTRHVLTEVYQESFDFVDSLYWPARAAAANLLLEKHQLKEAKEDFEAILKQNAKVADAHVGLGVIALEDWGFDETQKHIDAALEINANSVAARVLLARMRMTERKYQEAADAAEAALKVNPNALDAMSVLAAARLRLGDEAGSQAICERVEKLNPRPAVLHQELGKWLSAGRQFAEAERHLKKAIEFAPTWSDPPADLGQLYMETGEEGPARRTLEAAFALDSFNMHTHNLLQLLDQLDRFSRLETKHFVIKFDPKEDSVAASYLGDALESFYPEVTSHFRLEPGHKTIIEMFPDHMGFSVRITGRPFIATVGACTGRVIAFTAPRGRPPFGRFNWAGMLRHEFTHTVTLAATENRIPHWMTEGLAVHEEPVPQSWATKKMLARALRKGDLFDLQTIDWGFMRPRKPNDRSLAYAQSEWMIQYIVAQWGQESLLRLLTEFRSGKTQAAAFTETLKLPPEEFAVDFKKWAGEQVMGWGLSVEPVEAPDDLREKIKDLEDDSPEEAGLEARLAESWLFEGDGEHAEMAARRALKKDENETRALEVLCSILVQKVMGEEKEHERHELVDEVKPYLERWKKARPSDPLAQKLNAIIDQEQGRKEEAIEALRKYQMRYPEDPDSYRRIGGMALMAGRTEEGLAQLLRLSELTNDEPAVRVQIGKLYQAAGDMGEAARWIRRALEIDPYDVDVHVVLAEALMKGKKLEEAEREYQAVCKLRPKERIGYDGLAEVCRALGRGEEAERYEQRARSVEGESKGP